MATKPGQRGPKPPPPKGAKVVPGKFQDPLKKWGPGVTKATAGMREDLLAPVKEANDRVQTLAQQLAQPNLSRAAKLTLTRSLIEARTNLKKAMSKSTDMAKDMKDAKRLQRDAAMKLNELKLFLVQNKGLEKGVLDKVVQSQKMLEQILLESSRMGKDMSSTQKALDSVDRFQDTVEELPEYLKEKFSEQDKLLQKINKDQQKAQDFLNEQRQRVKDLLKEKAKRLGMAVADKIGFGALNVGNLLRGVGKGIDAGRYIKKTLDAHATVRAGRKAERIATGADLLKQAKASGFAGSSVISLDQARRAKNAKLNTSATPISGSKTPGADGQDKEYEVNHEAIHKYLASKGIKVAGTAGGPKDKEYAVNDEAIKAYLAKKGKLGGGNDRNAERVADAEEETAKSITTYVNNNETFHKKVVHSLDKVAKAKGSGDGGGGIGATIAGLVGALGSFFGEGGVIKKIMGSLGTLGSVVGKAVPWLIRLAPFAAAAGLGAIGGYQDW